MPQKRSTLQLFLRPLPQLPLDVLKVLFSFLSFKDLINVQKVSRTWKKASEENKIWQNLTLRYFPHLPEAEPTEFAHFPRQLFFKTLQNVFKSFKDSKDAKSFLLQDFVNDTNAIIQTSLFKGIKHKLYTLSAATKGEPFIKALEGKIEPFLDWADILYMACIVNNLKMVRYCIEEIEKNIPDDTMKREILLNTLLQAAAYGQNQLVSYFIKEHIMLSDNEKEIVIEFAAATAPQRIQLLMAQRSETTVSSEIILFFFNEALEENSISTLLALNNHFLTLEIDVYLFDVVFLILKWAIAHDQADLVEKIVLGHRLNVGASEKKFFADRYLSRTVLEWANTKNYINISLCIEEHVKTHSTLPGHYKDDKSVSILPAYENVQQKPKKPKIGKHEIKSLCQSQAQQTAYCIGNYGLRSRRKPQ